MLLKGVLVAEASKFVALGGRRCSGSFDISLRGRVRDTVQDVARKVTRDVEDSTVKTPVVWLALLLGVPTLADEDLFSGTDPKTWSAAGAFDVKWGMGPGDVRKTYPDLGLARDDLDGPDCPIRNYRATSKVGRDPVEVQLQFFHGRLFYLAVMPDEKTRLTDLGLSAVICEKWLTRLRSKYGEPVHETDARIRGVSFYAWQLDGTSIRLSSIPILSYTAVQMRVAAYAAYDVWKERQEAKERARF
jgi:hypothetical protein